MPSDQQKMYDFASNLVRLLPPNISQEDAIPQIGQIVVGELSI
jgi:hypothetical protein